MGPFCSVNSIPVTVRRLSGSPPLEAACEAVCSHPGGFALSTRSPLVSDRPVTLLGCDPVDVRCCEDVEDREPLGTLLDRLGPLTAQVDLPPGVPFAGGWVGFVAYEVGRGITGGKTPSKPERLLPDARFALYDAVALFDHVTRRWTVAGIDLRTIPGWPGEPVFERLDRLTDLLANATANRSGRTAAPLSEPPVSNFTRSAYLAAVDRAKAYIAAGDVYQVNLTQRFSAATEACPLSIYHRLCRANPAPYAAYLAWDDKAILSASPELFLDARGGQAITRPIKGTRPRIGDPLVDAAGREALNASEKDHAELNMIVDLLRNDLGRVSRFGSVRVSSPGTLETHPTVFHRVATITAELAKGRSWADLLQATFPGGSITGAPKIRAMEIIDELEPTPRDVYCGSIGYIGLDGSLCLNIAIRTMVYADGTIHAYAGGGIVADSDPVDEYDESLAKAAGMMRALGYDTYARATGPGTVRSRMDHD